MTDEEQKAELQRLKDENAKLTKDLWAKDNEVTRLAKENQSLEATAAKVAEIQKKNDDLTNELKDTRHEARDRRLEAKTLKEQMDALTKERDDLKAATETDPEGLRAKLAATEDELRKVKHGEAFARAAKKAGVSEEAIADLYILSGYKPDADAIDEAKLGEVIATALKGRERYLTVPSTATPTPTPTPTPTATTTAADAAKTAAGAATATATTTNGSTNGTAAATTTTTADGKPGPGADRGASLDSDTPQPKTKIPGSFARRPFV